MSTLTVATVRSNSSSPPVFQNTSGTEVGTLCRAWVNFNGQGVVAISGQFNVSSITDNGVGDYTVNFTTAMADANYCVTGSIGNFTAAQVARSVGIASAAAPTTSAVRIVNVGSGTAEDPNRVSVAIFR